MRRKGRPKRVPRPSGDRKFLLWVFIGLAVAVVALGLHQLWQRGYIKNPFEKPPQQVDYVTQCDRLDQAVHLALEDLGAAPVFVTQSQADLEDETGRWRFRHLTIRVAGEVSLLRCNLAVTEAALSAGGEVLGGGQPANGKRLTLELGVEGRRSHLLEIIPDDTIAATRGYMAIIIDDFGAINNQAAVDILDLPIPLTAAVIPGHPTSGQIARQAKEAGHEVFVHLAMQPKDGECGEENPILVDLEQDEIRRRVRWALDQIPGASGVNNHMGSLATEDREVMETVLREIKAAGKFFVDSRTSSRSVACVVAREMDLLCAARDDFLDYEDVDQEIRKSLQDLADKALQEGTAIGIGHVRANTLAALQELIPGLERKGLRFVHVSRLLQIRQRQ
jgi:polysaccharide deacetylase 2 family uncharacterized protein YibQ